VLDGTLDGVGERLAVAFALGKIGIIETKLS